VAWQDGRHHGGTTHIRLNLALPHARVREAMERMKQYIFIN
jgi:cystathionine beta-lyase